MIDRMVLFDDRFLRADGKVEDLGDFSDFYIQPDMEMDPRQRHELQKMQDEVYRTFIF